MLKRIGEFLTKSAVSMANTLFLYPSVMILLAVMTATGCLDIWRVHLPEHFIDRLALAVLLGVASGAAFSSLSFVLRGIYTYLAKFAGFAIGGVYFIVLQGYAINPDSTLIIKTVAISVAFAAIFLWLPSFTKEYEFNFYALHHFKSALISALYTGVISLGLAAVVFAVDKLLIPVKSEVYPTIFVIAWAFFAPLYYLSLLPKGEGADEVEFEYPKFLKVLISYIVVPLLYIYAAVIVVYAAKIAITRTWPIGQVGPIVLGFSIAGLAAYILASPLDNAFAKGYHKIVPYALLFSVVLQLISIFQRLMAYGITVDRYYLALGAVFTLISAAVLTIIPEMKNGRLALIAAVISVISVVPPVDAFTVSRYSQIIRAERILTANGMLKGDTVGKSDKISDTDKRELAGAVQYIMDNGGAKGVKWLPGDMDMAVKFEKLFGYKPDNEFIRNNYANMYLDNLTPVDIAGYDVMLNMSAYGNNNTVSFDNRNKSYKAEIKQNSDKTSTLIIGGETELIGIDITPEVLRLINSNPDLKSNSGKGSNVQDEKQASFVKENNACKVKVVVKNANITYTTGSDTIENASYELTLLVKIRQ